MEIGRNALKTIRQIQRYHKTKESTTKEISSGENKSDIHATAMKNISTKVSSQSGILKSIGEQLKLSVQNLRQERITAKAMYDLAKEIREKAHFKTAQPMVSQGTKAERVTTYDPLLIAPDEITTVKLDTINANQYDIMRLGSNLTTNPDQWGELTKSDTHVLPVNLQNRYTTTKDSTTDLVNIPYIDYIENGHITNYSLSDNNLNMKDDIDYAIWTGDLKSLFSDDIRYIYARNVDITNIELGEAITEFNQSYNWQQPELTLEAARNPRGNFSIEIDPDTLEEAVRKDIKYSNTYDNLYALPNRVDDGRFKERFSPYVLDKHYYEADGTEIGKDILKIKQAQFIHSEISNPLEIYYAGVWGQAGGSNQKYEFEKYFDADPENDVDNPTSWKWQRDYVLDQNGDRVLKPITKSVFAYELDAEGDRIPIISVTTEREFTKTRPRYDQDGNLYYETYLEWDRVSGVPQPGMESYIDDSVIYLNTLGYSFTKSETGGQIGTTVVDPNDPKLRYTFNVSGFKTEDISQNVTFYKPGHYEMTDAYALPKPDGWGEMNQTDYKPYFKEMQAEVELYAYREDPLKVTDWISKDAEQFLSDYADLKESFFAMKNLLKDNSGRDGGIINSQYAGDGYKEHASGRNFALKEYVVGAVQGSHETNIISMEFEMSEIGTALTDMENVMRNIFGDREIGLIPGQDAIPGNYGITLENLASLDNITSQFQKGLETIDKTISTMEFYKENLLSMQNNLSESSLDLIDVKMDELAAKSAAEEARIQIIASNSGRFTNYSQSNGFTLLNGINRIY